MSDFRVSRREFVVGGAATLALAACGGNAPAAQTSGGSAPAKLASSVTFASQTISDTLDPHGTLSNSGFMMVRQLYDALVTFDEPGKTIVPQLATEWKRIDPLTMEFKLRDDVKFANGEPFTSDAVVYNVDRIMRANDPLIAGGSRTRMGPLDTAEAVDKNTVRIKTKSPDPILINRLTTLFMVSPKFVKDGNDPKTKSGGSGSFNVTDFQTTKAISLEARDSWRGASTVQTAKIVAIPELAAFISALKTGEVDIAWNFQGDQLPGIKNDFNVGIQEGGSCNISSLIPGLVQAIDDKRVRTAINLAVNKDELIKTVQGGVGTVAQGQLLSSGITGYNDAVKAFPFDPDKAKSLLKDAGFASFDAPFVTSVPTLAIVQAIAGYLKAVGINLPVKQLEFPAFVQNLTQKTDSPLISWNTDYFHIRDFDTPGLRFAGLPPGQPHFKNDEMTRLYLAARQELDATKRTDMIKQMSQIMYDEAACLFLFQRQFAVAYTKKIANLALPYDTSVYLWKVQKAA